MVQACIMPPHSNYEITFFIEITSASFIKLERVFSSSVKFQHTIHVYENTKKTN